MPTLTITPFNQAQYQATMDGDHAVDLPAGDRVEVQAGALVSATGATAHGVVAATGSIAAHIYGGGVVSSTQGNGITTTGNFFVQVDPTGRVSGAQFGILFGGGGNILRNKGIVNGFSGVGSSDNGQPQTIINDGSITGTTQHGINLRGPFYLTNTGTIVGQQNGIYSQTGAIGNYTINNLNLIRGGEGQLAISILPSTSSNVTINNSGRIEGGIHSLGTTYYEGRNGVVTGLLTFGNANDTAYGGAVSENMDGELGNDFLHGGGGNDILDGSLGDDTMNGGDGFDTVVFGDNADPGLRVNMGNPNDPANTNGADTYISIEALIGDAWADHFIGNADANTFTGKAGNDTLDGAGGNDTLIQEAGDGNDSLVGGSGIDTVSFSGTAGAAINLAVTTAQTTVYGSDTLSGIENLTGGAGADAFTGDGLANVLIGHDGADTLKGMSGNDLLYGGNHADQLFGGTHTDQLFGDAGNDLLSGEAGNDLLYGGADQDRLSGGSENDRLFGENGNDLLYGDAGNDVLSGGTHNDRLYGGAGKDALTGGAGRDIFVFNTALNRTTNVDKITDFSVRDDTVWLDNRYMAKLGSGSEARPGRLNSKYLAFDSAKDTNDYLIYVRKSGALLYDADGSGSRAAVTIAVLTKNLKLTTSDFQII